MFLKKEFLNNSIFQFYCLQILYMLNIVKLNLINKDNTCDKLKKKKTLKHHPSSVREWNNSIYVHNRNALNLIPSTTMSAINIIKSYFSLYNFKKEKLLRTKKFFRMYRVLSLNKIYVSNGEFKHTNNKVIINLYLFNRQKYNYILALRKLYLKKRYSIKKSYMHNHKHKINILSTDSTKFNTDLAKSKFNIYKSRDIKLKKYKYSFKPEQKIINTKNSKIKKYKLQYTRYNNNILGITLHNTKYTKSCVKFFKNKLNNLNNSCKHLNIKFNDKRILMFNTNNLQFNKLDIYAKYYQLCAIYPRSLMALLETTPSSQEYINTLFIEKKAYWEKSIKLDLFESYDNLFIFIKNIIFGKSIFIYNKHIEINNINFDVLIKNAYISKKNTKKYKLSNKTSNHNMIKGKVESKVKDLFKKELKLTNLNIFLTKKVNAIREKGLLLLKLINKEKYLVVNNLNQNKNKKTYFFISTYITNFYKNFIRKSLKKLKVYFYYRQLMYMNKSKFNYSYLQYLNKYMHLLYNKNIEYNLINLKQFYLNSDILSESIKSKLTRKRRGILKKLKKLKKKFEKKILRNVKILSRNEYRMKINYELLDYKPLSILPSNQGLSTKKIVKTIKHKKITGFRIEAKGRLTRRYTASKSMSKNIYKGNLLNPSTSYRRWPSVLLKGNLRSNLQHTKLKSKSSIGSFGIKGWVSGN